MHGDFVATKRPLSAENAWTVVNPATEEPLAVFACSEAADVDAAVRAAREAFDDVKRWQGLSGGQRAVYLRRLAKLVTDNKRLLAELETRNMGKPLAESVWDMGDVAACFEYFARKADELDQRQNSKVELPDSNFKCEMRYEPFGVVGAIIPWNYPMLMMAWKVAPALAAGCTVVLKPSELTPLSALEFARLTREAELPRGVFNVLLGAGATGALLAEHALLDKVAFTGSVPTGAKVGVAAARGIKGVTLELGGKSAAIVFEDCDFTRAVEWVMFGCYWTNGQICSATSRLLVHESIADRFLARLVAETRKVRVVDPNLPEFAEEKGLLGPIVSRTQLERVRGFVEGALAEGATLLTGGRSPPPGISRGFFIEPTILAVTPSMRIWREEVFGPVLSVVRFKTEEEAVRLANDSTYGLAGAVLSRDAERCARVTRALRTGIAWINCSQPAFVEAPWGGMKQSGVGRELGERGIDTYLQPKQVTSYVADAPFCWYPVDHSSKE